MYAIENKFVTQIVKNRVIIFCVFATLLAMGARYGERSFASLDMSNALLSWYEQAKTLGVESLAQQIGDYNLPYQLLVWIGTLVPIEPMYWFKIISIIFDFILAVEIAFLIRDITNNNVLSALAYGLTLFLPEQLLNSALWGQCDAIYSALLVASLRCLLKEMTRSAFFLLGLSLSLKLQACFIIPFYFFYYLNQRNFSIIKSGWSLLGFYLLSIPGIIMRRDIFAPFAIYLSQTDQYHAMFMNFPSFWGLFRGDYSSMKWSGIALTVFIILCGFLLLLKTKPLQKSHAVLVVTWMVFTCVEYLPAMHER